MSMHAQNDVSSTSASNTAGEKRTPIGRRGFLRTGAVAAGGMAIAACLPEQAHAAAAGPRQQMAALRKHEADHVNFLVGALGAMARPKPIFKNLVQPNLNSFLTVAQALENTGVGAYLGAAPAIFDPGYLGAAASIALIEARHAGFINAFRSQSMTQNVFGQEQSFDMALTIEQVVTNASPFIMDLNGPPLTFSATRSAANDINILNFALALEYLESDFYNLNVQKFYGI